MARQTWLYVDRLGQIDKRGRKWPVLPALADLTNGSEMNRRVFMKTSVGLAASGWIGHAFASHPRCRQPAIAIVDPSLSESVRCAAAAARGGARVVECGIDVATLWYAGLARTRAPLVGALRGSDFFVLRHLARSDGRAVMHEAVGAGIVAFRIIDQPAARSFS